MAMGCGLNDDKLFVGSLRSTGFAGNIILGVSSIPPLDRRRSRYLRAHSVQTYPVNMTDCSTTDFPTLAKPSNGWKPRCTAAYPHLKMEWARFLLYRDWLMACSECTGWVLVTDYRDVYFQSDPFANYAITGRGPGQGNNWRAPNILVFEEISGQTTDTMLN